MFFNHLRKAIADLTATLVEINQHTRKQLHMDEPELLTTDEPAVNGRKRKVLTTSEGQS